MSAVAEIALQEVGAPPPVQDIVIDPDKQYEYVNGHVVIKKSEGARHSRICARLCANLGWYVEEHQLGAVYGPDTTFTFGQNQRMPDVSFVSASRIPPEGDPVGIWTIAPDLAVEVVSPNDLHEDLIEKIHEYFAAGVRQVWLLSPQFKTVTIYATVTRSTTLTEDEELTCEELLPGFRCSVRSLFQPPVHA